MSVDGIPVGGLKTVGQIVATNNLTFQAGQDGLAIAVALVSSHTPGAPVVDRQGKYLGFIHEFDVMRGKISAYLQLKRSCERIASP